MDPPFPPPEMPPPAPPSDQSDQEPSSSPSANESAEEAAAAERKSLTEAAAIHTIGKSGDEENGGGHHSMPNLEEARTEGVISAGGAYSKHGSFLKGKRGLALTGLIVGALIMIVGFSVAISNNNKVLSAAKNNGEPEDPSLSNTRNVSRLKDVQEYLSARVSTLSALQNHDAPQYKAALWIADQDARNVPLPSDPKNYDASYEFVQRYILAVFYFALDGANWIRKVDFLSEKSECDWHVDLDEHAMPDHEHYDSWKYGVQCTDGAVSHIFLSSNELTGELPSEMGDLLDLVHLSLFKNKISGSLPKQLEHWGSVEFVSLESNQLSGTIPEWISRWTSLLYLNLGDNKLTGSIPSSLSSCTSLIELALDYNAMTGSLDNLESLTDMRKLYLNDNKFSGRIHEATFRDMEELLVVDLSRNEFTGYFPAHFYNLREVDLHMNKLNEKPLPAVTADNLDSPLKYLSVYGNDMPGAVPNTLGFLSSLEHLDLSENQFTGAITDTFDNLRQLKSLYLSMNPFNEGQIPDLRDCRNLEALSMTGTNRIGSIHSWVGSSFSDLELLDLHNNKLTGTIPTNFGELSNVKLLFLNHNMLTGDVPTELAQLPNIVSFFAHNNELVGSFEPVCNAKPAKLAYFVTDCKSEVTCTCCSECCASGDSSCVNDDENMDTLNEMTSRDAFMFAENVIFPGGLPVSQATPEDP